MDLIKMNKEHIKIKAAVVRDINVRDDYGNPFDLIDGYMDSQGEIIRVIFRNMRLNYIKIWNLVDEEIVEKVYKFK
jgi:hypothetical protein